MTGWISAFAGMTEQAFAGMTEQAFAGMMDDGVDFRLRGGDGV